MSSSQRFRKGRKRCQGSETNSSQPISSLHLNTTSHPEDAPSISVDRFESYSAFLLYFPSDSTDPFALLKQFESSGKIRNLKIEHQKDVAFPHIASCEVITYSPESCSFVYAPCFGTAKDQKQKALEHLLASICQHSNIEYISMHVLCSVFADSGFHVDIEENDRNICYCLKGTKNGEHIKIESNTVNRTRNSVISAQNMLAFKFIQTFCKCHANHKGTTLAVMLKPLQKAKNMAFRAFFQFDPSFENGLHKMKKKKSSKIFQVPDSLCSGPIGHSLNWRSNSGKNSHGFGKEELKPAPNTEETVAPSTPSDSINNSNKDNNCDERNSDQEVEILEEITLEVSNGEVPSEPHTVAALPHTPESPKSIIASAHPPVTRTQGLLNELNALCDTHHAMKRYTRVALRRHESTSNPHQILKCYEACGRISQIALWSVDKVVEKKEEENEDKKKEENKEGKCTAELKDNQKDIEKNKDYKGFEKREEEGKTIEKKSAENQTVQKKNEENSFDKEVKEGEKENKEKTVVKKDNEENSFDKEVKEGEKNCYKDGEDELSAKKEGEKENKEKTVVKKDNEEGKYEKEANQGQKDSKKKEGELHTDLENEKEQVEKKDETTEEDKAITQEEKKKAKTEEKAEECQNLQQTHSPATTKEYWMRCVVYGRELRVSAPSSQQVMARLWAQLDGLMDDEWRAFLAYDMQTPLNELAICHRINDENSTCVYQINFRSGKRRRVFASSVSSRAPNCVALARNKAANEALNYLVPQSKRFVLAEVRLPFPFTSTNSTEKTKETEGTRKSGENVGEKENKDNVNAIEEEARQNKKAEEKEKGTRGAGDEKKSGEKKSEPSSQCIVVSALGEGESFEDAKTSASIRLVRHLKRVLTSPTGVQWLREGPRAEGKWKGFSRSSASLANERMSSPSQPPAVNPAVSAWLSKSKSSAYAKGSATPQGNLHLQEGQVTYITTEKAPERKKDTEETQSEEEETRKTYENRREEEEDKEDVEEIQREEEEKRKAHENRREEEKGRKAMETVKRGE